jgi:cholesterol oxidase
MRASADAVVIGSGFGGSVCACRLAQAGQQVVLLERGRRYGRGEFPRDPDLMNGGWLWTRGQGLFDIRPLNDVCVVQAAGYGGGSLVYANVAYRPPADLFAAGWPAGYSRDELNPYYDLAAYMLDVAPIAAGQPNPVPPKTLLMEKVADELGRREQSFRPNLAINFGPPDQPVINRFGVEQSGCTHCGECDIGCNVGAKNTLDMNYLAVAERAGAEVATRCEVTHIARDGDRYVVHYQDHQSGAVARITAPAVFVCAGAINSTELLLRSRDHYRTLPDLSEWLGRRYSANGDFLAFAFDTQAMDDPGRGPTITTALVYDDRSPTERTWFVLEEGGYPNLIAGLLQLLNPGQSAREDVRIVFDEIAAAADHQSRRITRHLAEERDRSAIFLAMGRDQANGTIRLAAGPSPIRVEWDVPPNLPLYVAESGLCTDVATALGGRYESNPGWRFLHQPVSVHNLGGCPMGATAADGVVDPDGEVFGYPGLYVLDGAIIPVATGANPSSTIAAVAERCVERAIRRMTGDAGWQAPERAQAPALPLPEDGVRVPETGTPPPRTPSVGMRMTETMQGTITPVTPVTPGSGPPAAIPTRFRVTLSMTNLALYLADPTHPAAADGTVWVDGYTGPEGAPIAGGTFHLFTAAGGFYRRKMLYNLPFAGQDGRPYVLSGYKEVWDHGHFDVWPATSTLYATLTGGEAADQQVATGVLKLTVPMFARQLSTVRLTGRGRPYGEARMLGRFAGFFTGTLFDVFVRSRLDP